MTYIYVNTSISGPPIGTTVTAPYIGDRDPLLARLWAVIEGYAYRAGIDRDQAAVMLANSEMPRSGL